MRNVIEVGEEKPVFQLFFSKEDEDQSVEFVEVEEIPPVERCIIGRQKRAKIYSKVLKRTEELVSI